MAGTIHFRDMLTLMDQQDAEGRPVPFSLTHYTHNRKTLEGGRRVELPQALHLTEAALPNPRTYTQRQASKAAQAQNPRSRHRPGDHWRNATRNLLLPDGTIHKCIIWLITEFNGMRVIH